MRQVDRYCRRLAGLGLAVFVVSAIAVGSASAAKQKIAFTAAGQALAHKAVFRLSDLGTGKVWTGGARKVDLNTRPACANYHPARSGLVITGAAASSFAAHTLGLELSSEAQVLRTPGMVALDWKQSVEQPAALACIGSFVTRTAGVGAKLVSAARVRFPAIGALTAEFRYRIDVPSTLGAEHFIVDFVIAASGRAEITVTTLAVLGLTPLTPARAATTGRSLTTTEAQLAHILVARVAPVNPLAA